VEGAPVVILTSVGAKSRKVRKNPLLRIVDGDRYVAVASHRGAADDDLDSPAPILDSSAPITGS
jgi:hypothetical protein